MKGDKYPLLLTQLLVMAYSYQRLMESMIAIKICACRPNMARLLTLQRQTSADTWS